MCVCMPVFHRPLYVHRLEVSLEKFCAGQEWGSLLEQNRPGLPLRGILSDQLSDQELRQLEERIMGATKHQVR